MQRDSFNAAPWSAYINVRADGTMAVRLPPVSGWCPNGKTIIFSFDAGGITKAIEAIKKHQEYVSVPFKKKKLPPHFMRNLKEHRGI